MGKVFGLIDGEISAGEFDSKRIRGCSENEIREIEAVAGFVLPEEYKCFMRMLGKSENIIKLFSGEKIYYPTVLELKQCVEEFFSIDWSIEPTLPKNAFVFFTHQGYEYRFFLPGQDDPMVCLISDRHHQPVETGELFSEFFEKELRFYKEKNIPLMRKQA